MTGPAENPGPALQVHVPAVEGWLHSVDDDGTTALRAEGVGGLTPPLFRVKHFREDRSLAEIAAGVVAELRIVLSDCTVLDVVELTDGPFGGDVVHVVLAFRSGLLSNTFFQWVCQATAGGYVSASLVCASEDAPVMASLGPQLLASVSLNATS